MSNYSFVSELARTGMWEMLPIAFHHYRSIIVGARTKQNLAETQWEEKRIPPKALVFKSGHPEPEEKLYTNAKMYDNYVWNTDDDDQIIHVTPIQGPITHGGAMCSYGTRELADAFMYAENHPKVIGHLVILDTPGGSANANDLNEQFQNAKKPVVGLIRGQNASKGVHISTYIPHVFAEDGNMEVGCIGALCGFSGMKSGTEFEGNIYYELYSEQNPEKNDWYREAIQKGNTEIIQNKLNELAGNFIENVKKRWPNVKEERLKGRMFPASEVIGELVDGIKSYADTIDYIFELAGVERKQKGIVTPVGILNTQEDNSSEEKNTPAATEVTVEEKSIYNPQNPKTSMELAKLKSILGDDVTAEVDDKGQVIMTQELTDRLADAALNSRQQAEASGKTVAEMQTKFSALEEQVQSLSEQVRPVSKGTGADDNDAEPGAGSKKGCLFEGIPEQNWATKYDIMKSAMIESGFMNPETK
ncbi:MAG: hypothetical protein LUE98_04665 [Tannerellaceae bacterium]|nr:hypothetical protein [Tannerellaceae bacterium]